ncbi:MAG: CsgG/HfaB family protein, partial [Muribaculaceae bacterium]|nr:CsgG/HfaB family protein [Muribaculaceae bacterium]
MKRFIVLTIVAVMSAMFGVDTFAAGKKVAVFVEGNITREQKQMVNSAVMSRLSGNGEYRAFERNGTFLKALEREHDYQLSGEVPESQIRKVGERLGVDYVIAVCAVLTSDDQCQMSARFINLETGEVLK